MLSFRVNKSVKSNFMHWQKCLIDIIIKENVKIDEFGKIKSQGFSSLDVVAAAAKGGSLTILFNIEIINLFLWDFHISKTENLQSVFHLWNMKYASGNFSLGINTDFMFVCLFCFLIYFFLISLTLCWTRALIHFLLFHC